MSATLADPVRTRTVRIVPSLVAAAALAAVAVLPVEARAGGGAGRTWKKAAKALRNASKAEAKADYLLARARALALPTEEERDAAGDLAKEEYGDAKEDVRDRYEARLELAEALGEEDLYRVDIDPAGFSNVIDNPYFPLVPGTTYTFRSTTPEGTEINTVEVTGETQEILGVDCVVVHDRVFLDGELVEDTFDWFAQDSAGNVWYFGESSVEYEGGFPADLGGSWIAGVDGAQPGIVMHAVNVPGETYRQEFYLGEAEDYATVLALDSAAQVPYGNYAGCVETLDASPLEPDVHEHKFYAPGVGLVLETDPDTGERVELIDVSVQ